MKTLMKLTAILILLFVLSCTKEPKSICYICYETTITQTYNYYPMDLISIDSIKVLKQTFCDVSEFDIIYNIPRYENDNTKNSEQFKYSDYKIIITETKMKCFKGSGSVK